MPYKAQIITDSVGPNRTRLTTFQVRFPRFILPEVLTHRAFSRNTKSSRAKPIRKYIREILDDPVEPVHWGRTKKGMQAGSDINHKWAARLIWFAMMYVAISAAWLLDKLKLHKQITNRLLECWLYTDMVITSTNFDNFFHLRIDKAAQPEIQYLAVLMAREYYKSIPKELRGGEWHLPYILESEKSRFSIEQLLKMSAARCARISYKPFDGESPDPDSDFALYIKLVGSDPIHASPCESQAQAVDLSCVSITSNLKGWRQHRKMLLGEYCESFDYRRLKKFERGYIYE